MGWRWSRRPPADRQRRAAAAAEFLADLDRGAAGGTPHGQFGAALRAEATVGPVVVVTGRTTHWVSGQLVVADRDDLELFGAARRSHRDDVADLCLQERRRDRRDPRDAPAGGIELVDADDAHGPFGAGFVRHRGIGADAGTGSAMFSAAPPRSAAIALSMILRWPRRTPSFSRSASLSSGNTATSMALSRNVSAYRSSESPRSQSAISKDPPDLALPARLA